MPIFNRIYGNLEEVSINISGIPIEPVSPPLNGDATTFPLIPTFPHKGGRGLRIESIPEGI
jgi:hypothetical protein